jgi:hypothetical protein
LEGSGRDQIEVTILKFVGETEESHEESDRDSWYSRDSNRVSPCMNTNLAYYVYTNFLIKDFVAKRYLTRRLFPKIDGGFSLSVLMHKLWR